MKATCIYSALQVSTPIVFASHVIPSIESAVDVDRPVVGDRETISV